MSSASASGQGQPDQSQNGDGPGFSNTQMQAMADMLWTQVDNTVNAAFKQIQQNPVLQGPHGKHRPQGEPGLDRAVAKDGHHGGLLKADDVGYFDPSAKGIEPVMFISHYTYYQDIYTFVNHLRDIVQLKGEPTVHAYTSTCLKGTALKWFTSELTEFEKESLCDWTLKNTWIPILIRCFKPCAAKVLQSLNALNYSIQDVCVGCLLQAFAQQVFHHTRAANIDSIFNQLMMVWQHLDVWL